jgi:hypothetical protein
MSKPSHSVMQKNHMTVWRCLNDTLRSDRSTCPNGILDDHGLPEALRHRHREHAGDNIGRPAGGEGHDQHNRSTRKGLRLGLDTWRCCHGKRHHGCFA